MGTFIRSFLKSFPLKNAYRYQGLQFRNIIPVSYIHCSKIFFNIKGQEIKMPSLSPTMTEGTIIQWLKKEGDPVNPGDILCEILTDKAVVGFEVEDEGILAKILVPNDTKDVKIGTIIGLLVDPGEDWQNVQIPEAVSSETTAGRTEKNAARGGGVQGITIKMPSLSPTMTEGTIVKWLKKEGESFAPGDALCEIQTDKAIVAFEVEEEGILAKILVPEDTKDIKLGTPIAIMVMEGEDWKNVSIPAPDSTPKVEKLVSEKKDAELKSEEPQKLCGPSVRNLLREYGIEYSLVTATGPHNVLLKGDVLKYISSQQSKPIKVGDQLKSTPDTTLVQKPKYLDIPLTSMRQTIAKRLTLSKTTIPHAYMTIDCIVGEAAKLRSSLKSKNIPLSMNDIIIKCAAEALLKIPEVNVTKFQGKVKQERSVDISIAVATEKGLITPIVKAANTLALQQISESVKALAAKARAGRLKPQEYQGGSFAISNLGMFGISEFSAIISPPQGAILAVGSSKLSYSEKGPLTKMSVTLSYDASLITEIHAAKFLQCFKEHLENPVSLLVKNPVLNVKR